MENIRRGLGLRNAGRRPLQDLTSNQNNRQALKNEPQKPQVSELFLNFCS
jgi:hypothetical protein